MRPFLPFLIALFFPFMVLAQETPVHGLSMHGDLKYQADFDHLDYVSTDSKKGGKLVHASFGTFDTLNAFNIKGNKADGLDYLYDPLMARVWDEPFSLYGLVAEKVIIPEDRSEITYILNPKARFHDGTAITTEDVKFSFEKHREFGKPVTRKVYGLVKTVEIKDTQTIRFAFDAGYDAETAMILSLMRIVPKHYWVDKDFGATTLEPPLGSGPYKVKSMDAGRQIVYERVADYWAADLSINRYQYNFDTIQYDYYRDQGVAFEALKAGKIDLWRENDIGRWLSGYEASPNIQKTGFEHGRPEWLRAIIFNTRKSIFEDVNVREALHMAFPYLWINKSLYHKSYKLIDSVFANSDLAAPELGTHNIIPDRMRVRQASKMLSEAGWVLENGVLKKDDQSLEFEILLNDPKDEKIALTYSKELEKLGVKANVRTVDSAQFQGRLNDFDYDMVFYRWINSLSPGNEQYIYWGSQSADQQGTRNYAGVKNEIVDAAIHDLVHAKTRAALLEAAHRMDLEIMKNHYFVPLYYLGKDNIAHSKALGFPAKTPVYGTVVETWWQK